MVVLRRLIPCTLLLSTLGGCDRIQALVGGDTADAKAAEAEKKVSDPAKADATPTRTEAPAAAEAAAKAEAPAKAEAKVEIAAASPTEAAPPPAAATPAAAAAPPCIVGTWEATDYMARIDREMRKDKDLAKLSYKSHSGTIGYVIDPPTDGGAKGLVRAKAADYTYRFAGKIEGFAVSLVLEMNGDTEAEYELAEPSRILVGKPKSDTMKVKANAKVTGIASASQSKRVNHAFDGDHTYECSETELLVWDDPTKKGRPIKFKRKPA
jgi:hypothetical protein